VANVCCTLNDVHYCIVGYIGSNGRLSMSFLSMVTAQA